MRSDDYAAPIAGLEAEELATKLRASIAAVQGQFPFGTGVAVFVFDLNAKGAGGFGWIANAKREDMIVALLEWIKIQRGRN